LPSELNAAFLWAQLEVADEINRNRLKTWECYDEAFRPLERAGKIVCPVIPEGCTHNAHMYYIKCRDIDERTAFINFMKARGILCVFHYIPLHSAPAGLKYGRFDGVDKYTTKESERLVRLPLYYNMSVEDREAVIEGVKEFFK